MKKSTDRLIVEALAEVHPWHLSSDGTVKCSICYAPMNRDRTRDSCHSYDCAWLAACYVTGRAG